ncbi:AI-2E family transporter [Aquabacterium sp. A7-Y]|uniref:AI-2E family transporter n=1 Tax=Aquabacterium sp. A7-Y TaxID=1349605 RepID=UPI00223CAF2D|nr:AI-2E family transporter [Aquabacterium sp. A7-Y]MCW7538131.1 AI-2E family transporter [Aquabacterium sp. A7-Y]
MAHSPPPDPAGQPVTDNKAFLLVLAAVTLAFFWILRPFYGAVLWGAIIAILFAPVHRRLLPHLRQRPTLAALATLSLVVVIVILPLFVLSASMAQEGAAIYARIQSGELNFAAYFERIFASLPSWITELLNRFNLGDLGALQRRITAALAQGSQVIATRIFSIGQDTFDVVVSFFITLYLAFFLIRDGGWLSRRIGRAIPLEAEHKQQLFTKFATVIRATVKGNVVVAATQGALGGLAFAFLDISGAIFWAVLMAFLSLLPAVGAALVWLPVAIYFLATGAVWQGVALIVYGVIVIGLVDNVLRPVLVGKDTKMPDYVVMITTLGGMVIFGINGFVIGPVIAAMFIAVWDIFVTDGSVQQASAPHIDPPSAPGEPAVPPSPPEGR